MIIIQKTSWSLWQHYRVDPKVEIKDYIAVIDGRNFFNQPIQNDKIKYDNIQKIAVRQEDDYTTGCLLDYIYFKENYKLTSIDLLIANS